MGSLKNLLTGKLPQISAPTISGLSSPINVSQTIQQLAFADFFQGEIAQTSRGAAMQVPAVARARSILVGVIAGMPLRTYDANGNEMPRPAWMESTNGPIPIWHRMAWTVDDLLFYGRCLWTVVRDGSGAITDAARVPIEMWGVDEYRGEILVNGQPVPSGSVLYIPGADEGLLAKGGPSIKGARAIERAWVGRAQNPIPLVELHQITDDEVTDEEKTDIINAWAVGRTSPTGAIGFTDNRVEVRVHGTVQADLFIEARNASVLDLARHANVPAALLDGSMSTATLTYSTSEGKSNEFWDYSLPIYTAPLEARLSQDDVVPAGQYTRLDRTSAVRLPQPTTAPGTDD